MRYSRSTFGLASSGRRRPRRSERPVDRLIVVHHALHREPSLELAAADGTVDGVDMFDRRRQLLRGVADDARAPGLEDLGYGAHRARDHRRAAGHGLDHDEAERLGPVDGEDKGEGAPEELGLVVVSDLADELDERMPDERLYLALEVLAVGLVYLGRDLQGNPHLLRDLDGQIRPLLRREPAEKREVRPSPRREPVGVSGQAVIDGAEPVQAEVPERFPLRVADRDQWHIAELPEDRLLLRLVQATVHGVDRRRGGELAHEKREVVHVTVDEVEFTGAIGDLTQ